jgi:hypothetical protein
MGVRLYLAAMNLVAKISSEPDELELLGHCPCKSPPEMNAATLKCNGFETVFNNNTTCSKQCSTITQCVQNSTQQ